MLSRSHALFFFAITSLILFTSVPSPARAAIDPLAQCRAVKLKSVQANSKKVFTCSGSQLKGGVAISTFDATCITPVNSKFTDQWDKAIAIAAAKQVSCFNAPGSATTEAGVTTTAAAVSATLRSGFSGGDDTNPLALKILNDLMKSAESYLTSTLAAEAKHAAKPDAGKLAASRATAAAALTKKFNALEAAGAKKGVVLSANDSSVLATIDAWVGTLASGIQTNPIFPVAQFHDSPVQGLSFAPALDPMGGNVTIKGGWFPVTTAGNMTFSVGGSTLGSAMIVGSVVTPVTLLPGTTPGFTDERDVSNQAAFLQTLDDDGNPKNGITIHPAVLFAAQLYSLNFAQSTLAFEADPVVINAIAQLTPLTKKGARPLVGFLAAQKHLQKQLIGLHAGTYSGTYVGDTISDDSGSWTFKISKSGKLSGSRISGIDGTKRTFKGEVVANGIATFTNTKLNLTGLGTIQPDGTIAGGWSLFPELGTWSGARQ